MVAVEGQDLALGRQAPLPAVSEDPASPAVADVVLGARADQGRIRPVAVQVDLDRPFHTHFEAVDGGDRDIAAQETAFAADEREDLEVPAQSSRIFAPPMGVEIH